VETQRPEVSALAWTLLGIAWKNGRRTTLTSNAALKLCLFVLTDLVIACQEQNISRVIKLTGQPELPRNLLSFVASLSNEIDLKICSRLIPAEQELDAEPVWTSNSDYDHAVFLALGQTLANAAWPGSGSRDLHAPAIKQVLRSLAQCSERDIQVALIQNYVANVLQDYLDRAQARVAVRNAPAAIENEIRKDDCRVIAEFAYKLAISRNPRPAPEELQTGLSTAITRILENKSS